MPPPTRKKAKAETLSEANARVSEEVSGNIERVRSLAEAENAEGVATLVTETNALIAQLPADDRAELTKALAAAAAGQDRAVPAVAKPMTYADYEGVTGLIALGAEKGAAGVRQNIKTATTAFEVAAITLGMWVRMPNEDGDPDLMGNSGPAKAATKKLYRDIGAALKGSSLDSFDVKQGSRALVRSIQSSRTDVRAIYLRGLDADTPEGALERQRYARILADKPEETDVSAWVARHYDVSLKGRTELQREYHHAKKALPAAAAKPPEPVSEAAQPQTPDESVSSFVDRIMADFEAVDPATFESASEETKAVAREKLEKISDAINAMMEAID